MTMRIYVVWMCSDLLILQNMIRGLFTVNSRNSLYEVPMGGTKLAGLPWRGNHPPLLSNREGSLRRLNNLVKRLNRDGITAEYHQIIEDQKSQGVVELAPVSPTCREFYLPTDLNYWIKHPFEFSDPILKPEYL